MNVDEQIAYHQSELEYLRATVQHQKATGIARGYWYGRVKELEARRRPPPAE